MHDLLEAEIRSALARERVRADRPLTTEFREALGLGTVKGADLWYLASALFLRSRLAGISFLTLDRRQRVLTAALGFETGP